jgi:hypothetical protein
VVEGVKSANSDCCPWPGGARRTPGMHIGDTMEVIFKKAVLAKAEELIEEYGRDCIKEIYLTNGEWQRLLAYLWPKDRHQAHNAGYYRHKGIKLRP